ncbi:MAG: nuclear transport factor 2 family protein [Pseudomonadota bacterium]
MTPLEIGTRLIELTVADREAEALDELYAEGVVSIEGDMDPESGRWDGIAAVREKHAWWAGAAMMHQVTAEGPFAGAHSDQFVVRFTMDVTLQDQPRATSTEVGVYTVADGKIVRELYLPLPS